ncbi:hypothetical protein RHM65_08055 [Pseudomonas sp. CCI4.2]|uniref:hypothetical protein n=1 Tax=Pseudomonas sp. CCI4.2 TaxID=3048620 RepID=UPI002AC8B354|nr:hypothetical protein [Pseudomonas sp. CCI4.2]MEB0094447.1 hypothetical protein [Pseudomonas sp. CCI4.2]WPX55503.1 hypothetical protein RHM65_08055 [Pseudomonas sp. CCI4.2]
MTQSTLSSGPCCEVNKLIVQVTGNGHPDTQRLAFYEHDSLKRLDALTDSDRPETLTGEYLLNSALHVWAWSNTFKHRLWLEIASVDGAPIRVPLPEVSITPRQFDGQWNQIVPVVPFVALPGVNSTHDNGTPVLCRAGFIYVFLNGRVWRELEVRVDDERTTYHDVDFNEYRMGDEIEPRSRLATGQALEDIWLPSSWNNLPVAPQLCFSEIQLSGPRLRCLENDSALRRQRCQSPNLRSSLATFERLFHNKPDGTAMLEAFGALNAHDKVRPQAAADAHVSWLNYDTHAFPVSRVAPQRARQPGYEWLLDQPARYLCDLSGQFPVRALSEAHAHVTRSERGETAYQATPLETGAWAHWIGELCTPQLGDELWHEQPEAPDVLHRARQRNLYGVMLQDSHYRLRHLHTRVNDQQNLLQLCAARASRHAHHASALLVQQLVVPSTLGGGTNPLHKQLNALKLQGRIDVNRFTASGERQQLWRSLEMSQALLSECLTTRRTQQTLADHLSLEGFDYVAALHFVSQLFASLATRPSQTDPLAVNGEVGDAVTGLSKSGSDPSDGQRLIQHIANDETHPLHRMLWPALESQDTNAPYVQSAVPDINGGDGLFRPNALLAAVSCEVIDPKQLNTLDAYLLAGLVESGSLNNTFTGTLKAAAAALGNLFENLQGSVDTAERAVQAARNIPISTTSPAPVVNLTQQKRAVAQLRSMLPGGFGALHFLTHQEARNKNLYIFGLTDLPEIPERLRRPSLDYRSASDISMVEPQHYRNGGDLRPNTIVIAMPREHRVAQLVSSVNQRVNAAWQENMAEQEKVRGNAIQQAVKHQQALKSEWMYKALNSTPFAAMVGMLEVWNLRNEWVAWDAVEREKGQLRAVGGAAGAGLDLLIAMEALTVKLAGSQPILATARKVLFTIPETTAKRVLGSLSEYLVKEFSARLIAQMVVGSVFVGLNLYDAWYAHQWGDDAKWGHLLMAAGGLTGIASTMMVGGSTLLGMGPLGWITLIFVSIGVGLVYWLTSTPIEDWLSAGPFGPNANRAPHLQSPEPAFYYLVSLIADIRITVERNPEYTVPAYSEHYNPVPKYVREADTRIRIESNLPGLLTGPGDLSTKASCALMMVRRFQTRFDGSPRVETQLYPETKPITYRRTINGLEIFIVTPWERYAETARSNDAVSAHIEWQVRAQLTLSDGDSSWVFPAPKPKDPTPFNSTHAAPNFKEVGQLYWADETTHKARGDK